MADDDEAQGLDSDRAEAGISEGTRQRVIDSVNAMVMHGEGREAAMRKLEVNGITGSEAEAIYSAAMVDRVATVHAHYRSKGIKGLLFMAGALVLLALCFFVFHAINRPLWIIIVLGLVFGAWHFVNGLSGMLMARNHEGSIADLDD